MMAQRISDTGLNRFLEFFHRTKPMLNTFPHNLTITSKFFACWACVIYGATIAFCLCELKILQLTLDQIKALVVGNDAGGSPAATYTYCYNENWDWKYWNWKNNGHSGKMEEKTRNNKLCHTHTGCTSSASSSWVLRNAANSNKHQSLRQYVSSQITNNFLEFFKQAPMFMTPCNFSAGSCWLMQIRSRKTMSLGFRKNQTNKEPTTPIANDQTPVKTGSVPPNRWVFSKPGNKPQANRIIPRSAHKLPLSIAAFQL